MSEFNFDNYIGRDTSINAVQQVVDFIKRHPAVYKKFCEKIGIDESFFETHARAWVKIDFVDMIFRELFQTFLENKDHFEPQVVESCRDLKEFIAFVCSENFRSNRHELFRFAVSTFIDPKMIWSRLPQLTGSLTNYLKVEYEHVEDTLLHTTVRTRQYYRDAERAELNEWFSEVSFRGIYGLSDAIGSTLTYVRRLKSVSEGDEYCEYEFQWVRNNNMQAWLYSGLVFLISYLAIELSTQELQGFHPFIYPLLAATIFFLIYKNSAMIRKKSEFLKNEKAFEQQRETMQELIERVNYQGTIDDELMKTKTDLENSIRLATAGELSYNYLHDMESAISVIVMSTEILRNSETEGGAAPVSQIQVLESAGAQLVKMQNLIRKAAFGDISGEKLPYSLKDSLTTAINLVTPIAVQSKVAIESQIDFTPSDQVWASEGCLESVLLNLINNSVRAKYLNSEKRVKILGEKMDQQYCIIIQDNGCGIPEQVLDKIDHPFSLHNTDELEDSRKVLSSGFGLYKVKQSVEKMGGEMEIITSHEGTKITLLLRPAPKSESHVG